MVASAFAGSGLKAVLQFNADMEAYLRKPSAKI
jgi:hypothetical protein